MAILETSSKDEEDRVRVVNSVQVKRNIAISLTGMFYLLGFLLECIIIKPSDIKSNLNVIIFFIFVYS